MKQFTSLFLVVGIYLLSASITAQGEVYTWINEQGVREYGDEPPKNAKKAKLPELQRLPKETFSKQKKTQQPLANTTFGGYKSLTILQPSENAALLKGDVGNLQVNLAVDPALQPGHEITLFLNGKKVEAGPQLQFSLANLDRGSHLLHAQIKHKGTLLISSQKRRFHVQRASILNRARAQ